MQISCLPPVASLDSALLGSGSRGLITLPGGHEMIDMIRKIREFLRPANGPIFIAMPRLFAFGLGPMRRRARLVQSAGRDSGREQTARTIRYYNRVPASPSTFGASRVWAGRQVRECEERKERKRYELMPRFPNGRGRKSHRSGGSLVDPASSHVLVWKIKRCMSHCKPY